MPPETMTQPTTPATVPDPQCACGAPVDPVLLEIRELFPALSPDLCTACYATAERESQSAARDDRERAEHRERLARLSVIPPEILDTSTAHVAFSPALWLRVCEWRPECCRWLLITGLPGRCKTRVVGLLAKQLILDGHHVTWSTACEIQTAVNDLRSSNRAIEEDARRRLREWTHASVLVLDDLGKNTWTPTVEAKLFEIIDHRKTHYLATILTANTPPAEMLRTKELSAERGGPIVSRILEACRGWTIEAPEIRRAEQRRLV